MDIKSAKAELSAISAKLTAIVDDVKATNRDLTPAEIRDVEQDTERVQELKAQIRGLEKGDVLAGLRAEGADEVTDFKTGTTTSSPDVKGYLTPASLKATAQAAAKPGIKALVAGGSTVTPVSLDRNPLPIGKPGLGLLSLIPTKVRETPKYSYVAQSVRTNNAAVVEPGALKPTSVYTVKSVDGELAVYAHLSEYVDKFLLEDNDDLERFLQSELQYGIVRKVTADAVAAFSAAVGIQTVAFSGTAADSIYNGASAVSSLGYEANLLVIGQSDYDLMRLSKDAEERYIGGNPFEGGTNPGIWGMTTVISPDVAAGSALVLDRGAVGLSTDRAGIQTAWDAATRFDKNEVRARTEGRFAFDVFVPAAIATVDLTGV